MLRNFLTAKAVLSLVSPGWSSAMASSQWGNFEEKSSEAEDWVLTERRSSREREMKSFIIFIGVLCFNKVNFSVMVGKLNFAFGIAICVFGVLSVMYGFTDNTKSEEIQRPANQADPGVAQNNGDIKKV